MNNLPEFHQFQVISERISSKFIFPGENSIKILQNLVKYSSCW